MTTDTKALIAEARRAETDWTIGPGEMRELASRLAAALEEATPPDGWRVTEYERHGSLAGVFEVLDGGDVSWCADGVCGDDGMCLRFDTARAAIEAVGKGEISP